MTTKMDEAMLAPYKAVRTGDRPLDLNILDLEQARHDQLIERLDMLIEAMLADGEREALRFKTARRAA